MVLRFQRVTPIVSHLLPRPDDLGVTHGHNGQTDNRVRRLWDKLLLRKRTPIETSNDQLQNI